MLLRKVEERIEKYLVFLDDRKYKTIGYPAFMAVETEDTYRKVPENLEWKSIDLPYQYGREWATFWFKTIFQLPESAEGAQVFFEAHPHSDSLVFIDGKPAGALNMHHEKIRLTGKGEAGREYKIHIESYGGHKYPGCHPFEKEKIFLAIKDSIPEYPNIFSASRLCIKDEDAYALFYDVNALYKLAMTLDETSLRRNRILRDLYENLMKIHLTALDEQITDEIKEALKGIKPLLSCINGSTVPLIQATGHAHIDHAWLWPKSETVRKAARTFSNMCRYLEEFPEFIFLQSQPCQLELIAKEYPSIYKRILKAFKRGQWEPNGAMWVEADCNIPSGESLIRQFLIGKKSSRKLINYEGDTLWLPDVFGYSAALPQIMEKCEVDYFVTSKINWNDTTRFPYDTFLWKGIDGTGIKTTYLHVSYNGVVEPERLSKTWNAVQHKEIQDNVLMAVGEGDGGGGTHRSDLEMARRLSDLEGCPRVKWSKISDGLKAVFSNPEDLPIWQGELYLELHRGTYTSQGRLKRYNRKLEFALQELEALAVMILTPGKNGATGDYPKESLEEAWKILLTNQFHDIIPGSSIRKVNQEAEEEYRDLEKKLALLKEKILGFCIEERDSESEEQGFLICNTLSWERRSRVSLPTELKDSEQYALLDGETIYPVQKDISLDGNPLYRSFPEAPAFGGRHVFLKRIPEPPTVPFSLENRTLKTPFYFIELDTLGRICSLKDKNTFKEYVSPGSSLNTLFSAEDVPVCWDAWDIDEDYRLKLDQEERLLDWNVVSIGPCFIKIRSHFSIGHHSEIFQDMILYSHQKRIDFETQVDWQESHRLLKASFPLNIHSNTVKCEIQYGHVTRNTTRNQPSDRAQFEICAHKWVSLEEGYYGAALLNDCKYGYDVNENTINLTLLKSSKAPDPEADKGRHEFTYSFLPFNDGFSSESVIRPAYDLNQSLSLSKASPGEVSDIAFSLIQGSNPSVIIENIKEAEDGDGIIVRIYEAMGAEQETVLTFARDILWVKETNMLERSGTALSFTEKNLPLRFHRFEIKTLKLVLR